MQERSPDPISDPKAYQDLLVSLVGPDDPAEIQAAAPQLIRELVAEAGPDLDRRPEAEEWSVLECNRPHARRGDGGVRTLPLDPRPR